MQRKLVVLVHETTPAHSRNAITLLLKSLKVGYWHWFQFAWLIVDNGGRTVNQWRDLIMGAVPDLQLVVIDATHGTWAGLLQPKHASWLHESWTPKG